MVIKTAMYSIPCNIHPLTCDLNTIERRPAQLAFQQGESARAESFRIFRSRERWILPHAIRFRVGARITHAAFATVEQLIDGRHDPEGRYASGGSS